MTVRATIQGTTSAGVTHFGDFSTVNFYTQGGNASLFLSGENHATVAACIAEYLDDHLQASKQPPADPDPDFDDVF